MSIFFFVACSFMHFSEKYPPFLPLPAPSRTMMLLTKTWHHLPVCLSFVLVFTSARHLANREQDPGNAIPWTWSRPSGARSISDLDAQLARMEFPSKEALVRRGRPFSVDVEGIVGTGKSTCLNFFRKYPSFDILSEPLDKWTNLNGTDLLQLIYDDPTRWALAQESYVQLTMLEEHLRKVGVAKIQERSVHSARFVFSEYFFRRGYLQPVEYAILDGWFKLLDDVPEFHLENDLTVYLRNDPEIALERVRLRGRKEEANIKLSFLQDLHTLHEEWLVSGNNTDFVKPSKNILIVDATQSLEVCKELYEYIAQKVAQLVPEAGRKTCL